MLVSIILPTYNRANLLRRSIGSVIGQSYQDWELIIWDDGSTDDTSEVIASLNDGRIKYFHEDNHGVAYARNRAIEKSNGNLLAFLDSDDEWRFNKLAEQIEVMHAYPEIEVLFTDFDSINEASGKARRTFEHYAGVMKSLSVEKLEPDLFIVREGMLQSLAEDNFIATDTVMLRRQVLERTGGFNETLRNFEDFELWWRMGLAETCFAYMNQVCLTRYKPAGSLSSPSIRGLEEDLKGLDLCLHETISHGRNDLLPVLNISYRNIWQNLILAYGALGERRKALGAFINSLNYGFRPGSLRLLTKALFSII